MEEKHGESKTDSRMYVSVADDAMDDEDDEDDEDVPAAKPASAKAAAPKKKSKNKLFKVRHLTMQPSLRIAAFLACHHP